MTEARPSPSGIFISYRRRDSGAVARLLTSTLQDHFPAHGVFRDMNYRSGVKPGEDFLERIEEELAEAAAVIALIGGSWVDEFAERADRDQVDYLRQELETALSLGKPILPIRVGATEMPSRDLLPAGLEKLSMLQSLRLTDEHYETEVRAVVRALRRTLGIPEDEEPATTALDKRLLEAASRGAVKSIKLLVSQGANLEARDEEGATPLSLAAAAGRERAVSALCALGANVDATTTNNLSALLAALIHAPEPVVLVLKALLDAGADIELASDSGATPLLWACHRAHYDSVMMLLDHGANPNVHDENGSFPSAQWLVNAGKAGLEQHLILEVMGRLTGIPVER